MIKCVIYLRDDYQGLLMMQGGVLPHRSSRVIVTLTSSEHPAAFALKKTPPFQFIPSQLSIFPVLVHTLVNM
jgi:hypothetical protein